MYLLFFVSRLRVESRIKTPVIYLRYKAASDVWEGVDFKEHILNSFCFPLGPEAVQPKEVQASEEYTFGLTHNDGQRFTGFCRQIFPPAPRVGNRARYPQVLCIVAENPWCNFFFKVLQVAEQLLKGFDGLLDSGHKDLPLESHLGAFIIDLRKQLATNPAPGEVLRLTVPSIHGLSGVSPPRYMGGSSTAQSLTWGNDRIELQVPPDCGNGKTNSGIPLARLLFHVPVEGMLTLVASLLLERRIVFVARSRDTVTAAVQAAHALIYPFRWHHIYLPLLPRDLVDYLSAPMPFLVGLTSEMLPLIRHIPMSEVTMVDLDLQKVSPPPGCQSDDGRALPCGRQLGAALEAVFKTVRSPTEYESSPLITGVMQEYFVRLFGSYRRFIHEQGSEQLIRSSLSALAAAGALSTRGGGSGRESGRGYKEGRVEGRGPGAHNGGGDITLSPQGPHNMARLRDDRIRGYGYFFDQPAFVEHSRSETVRSFLNAMRHSQLYEMFIQERLQMAASGAIDLPSSNSCGYGPGAWGAVGGAGSQGRMMRRAMLGKSSSANNLTSLDQPSQDSSASGPASEHGEDLGCRRDPAGSAGGGGGTSPCSPNPFEMRVERYPERRRMLREHLRSLLGDPATAGAHAGGAAGGKLANKLRRHRRTDSEDLITQPQPFGPLNSGESMRRITTYPGIVDVSAPTLDDPLSYFAEWDLREDDDDASGTPNPSPLGGREHQRSESGNNLPSIDLGDLAGVNGAVPAVAAAGAPTSSGFSVRPDRTANSRAARERDRDPERDKSPLRRPSVSMLSTNAKSTYTSLRAAPSHDSPGPGERAPGPAAAAAAGALVAAPAGGAGARIIHNLFHANGGGDGAGGASDTAVAATVLKDGVQIKTLVDGQRVYDGTLKDLIRMTAADAKNGLLSGLSGLASPLSSPRSRARETTAKRQTREQMHKGQKLLAALAAVAPHRQPQPKLQHGSPPTLRPGQEPEPLLAASGSASAPLPHVDVAPEASRGGGKAGDAAAASEGPEGGPQQQQQEAAARQCGGDGSISGPNPTTHLIPGAAFLAGLKDKVAAAGTKAKALGILPAPGYKPQTTGEKSAKFKAQLAGGGGANLVAGADGKLKQPHAPQRPLGLMGLVPPFMGRSDASDPGPLHAPTPSFMTPMASPGGPQPAPEASARMETSFGPLVGPLPYSRTVSVGGIQRFVPHPAGGQAVVTDGGAGAGATGGGDRTPLTGGALPAPGSSWRFTAPYVPPASDWDPFGTGSAPPAAGGAASTTYSAVSSMANWSVGAVNGTVASTTTSPFAVSAHAENPAGSTASACGPGGDAGSGCAAAPAAGAAAVHSGSCDATTADLLGLSPSALSGVSSGFALPAGSGITFDPFAASDQVTQGRLESAGSNDFAAFASASSPRDFPGLAALGAAPVVG